MHHQRTKLLTEASTMAREIGLINVTRAALCERAGIKDGSFAHVAGMTFKQLVEQLRQQGVGLGAEETSATRVTNPKLRRQHILEAAVKAAQEIGYSKFTVTGVADRVGLSPNTINKYFGNRHQLKLAVMDYAVEHGVTEIIEDGCRIGDQQALNARTSKEM